MNDMKKVVFRALASLMLVSVAVSCSIQPVPVRLVELSDKKYIKTGKYCPVAGQFRRKCVALVYYDGIARALVDDSGQALTFHNNIHILNYLAPKGWEFLETEEVALRPSIRKRVMVLKNRMLQD